LTKTVNQGFYLYFKKIGGIPAKIVPGVHRHFEGILAKIVPGVHRHFEGILAKIVPGVHRHFEGIPAKIVPENRRGCVFERGGWIL